jgi:hypothetical protein
MGVKLSDLTTESAPAGNDIMLIADPTTGLAKKVTVSALKTLLDSLGGTDITAPTITARVVQNATKNQINLTFSEPVTATSAGFSAKKAGSAWSISSIAGSGTSWTLTMASDAANGDTLLLSYDSTTGNTVDAANNELVSFTDSGVTNNVAASYDSDAQTFFTNAGITDNTQKDAVNALVVGLKADSLWAKMKAIYPFVGGTAGTHKYNLKNPADTNAAYRIIFEGTVTHNANGITGNGTTGYANTKFNPSTNYDSLGSASFGLYFKTSDVGGNFGNGVAIDSNYVFLATAWAGSGNFSIGNNGTQGPSVSDSKGFWVNSRTSTTNFTVYKNGSTLVGGEAGASTAHANGEIFIGALNTGSAGYFHSLNIAFAFIGDGLDSTENANLNTRVTTFQTALGRQN